MRLQQHFTACIFGCVFRLKAVLYFKCWCHLLTFSKKNLVKNIYLRNTIKSVKRFPSRSGPTFVGPDLDPNCLQSLSADDTMHLSICIRCKKQTTFSGQHNIGGIGLRLLLWALSLTLSGQVIMVSSKQLLQAVDFQMDESISTLRAAMLYFDFYKTKTNTTMLAETETLIRHNKTHLFKACV